MNNELAEIDNTRLIAVLRVVRRHAAQGLINPAYQTERLRRIVIMVDRVIGVDAKNPVIQYPSAGDSFYKSDAASGESEG